MVVGQPLREETREARGREGCKCKGRHHSTTALGPRPSVLTLRLVADIPELRTERGLRSSGLEESAATGHLVGWGVR